MRGLSCTQGTVRLFVRPLKGFGALDRLLLGLMGVAVGSIGVPR